MIRRPAEAADVAFEVHATTNVPLNDVIAEEVGREPGALPLLSYVLDQLYRDDIIEAKATRSPMRPTRVWEDCRARSRRRPMPCSEGCAPEDRLALGSVLFVLVSKGTEEAGPSVTSRAVFLCRRFLQEPQGAGSSMHFSMPARAYS